MKSLLSVPILFLFVACSSPPYVIEHQPEANPVRSHPVFLVSHGWHAGLIVSGQELNRVIPELAARFGDAAYYELGWGDKGFYQSQEITTGLTLQAMFWSEGAVMHVVAIPGLPSTYFAGEEFLATCLSDSELASLTAFLKNSFERDAAGHTISLGHGIYGESQFYNGVGRYYILNTCNKWIAKALRSAGFDITPTFKLTSGSVMSYLATHRKGCTEAR